MSNQVVASKKAKTTVIYSYMVSKFGNKSIQHPEAKLAVRDDWLKIR